MESCYEKVARCRSHSLLPKFSSSGRCQRGKRWQSGSEHANLQMQGWAHFGFSPFQGKPSPVGLPVTNEIALLLMTPSGPMKIRRGMPLTPYLDMSLVASGLLNFNAFQGIVEKYFCGTQDGRAALSLLVSSSGCV